jgi:hypothetical protein
MKPRVLNVDWSVQISLPMIRGITTTPDFAKLPAKNEALEKNVANISHTVM